MSADDLLTAVRSANPTVRYAQTRNGNSIGEYVQSKGRFVPIYTAALGGKWCQLFTPGECIREVLTNGEPMHQPAEWVE